MGFLKQWRVVNVLPLYALYIIDGEDFSTSGSPLGYFPCRLDTVLRGLHAISKPCWAGSRSIHIFLNFENLWECSVTE